MKDPRFLTLDEVLAIHSDQVRQYGGSGGIRDVGLLSSALAMPRASFGGQYLHPSLHEMAAACLFHLVQNHPFIDGNKRTAFAATYTFLAINGAHLTADAEETYAFVAALYEANQFSFDKLVPWLREHVAHDPGQ